ncbi:b-glycosyltransferase [Tamlana nanhaiensis]|uniref:B-glycosyltransferase n=1 Tax=Neotamlana nanhaiensis TaxID=1382798 RepID=A0A0D7VZH4_9FLAO|nr:DUF2062 domain-containing protein [Tamlana nanhaiensis]KJD32113.1 b-glycosyltransferase [Tamlana nanhaiensis]KJD32275.1 b-glycosyltransferase [Tamlana nanhaiensis]
MKKEPTHFSICVIIPTYNNQKTLARVIDGVLNYSNHVIVVNDGSTDDTSNILKNYTDRVEVITFDKNKGKGKALREGFKLAIKKGYEFAITIDSDGQHFPEDIPNFVKALESHPDKNLLLIGSRNMSQEGVPKKSSFGNKFSNFWFWFETGIKLDDTQSGFRLYPLHIIETRKFFTNKFEFEIEVIVRLAWAGVAVKNMPVKVLYDLSERVTHFRPVKDFARISVLNTVLVLIMLLYIKPRNLFRRLKKKGIKRFFLEDFLGSQDSPKKKALSVGLGVFIGLSPLWGFHTVTVIFLAMFFKLNKTIAFAFSNVSIPPCIPFIIYFSSKIGQWLYGVEFSYKLDEVTKDFVILEHLETYIVGSFVLATVASIVLTALSFLLFNLVGRKNVIVKNG